MMMMEARDPYTREYREDRPMNQENRMEKTESTTAVRKAPVITGGRGLPWGAATRYTSITKRNTSRKRSRKRIHCQSQGRELVSKWSNRSAAWKSQPPVRSTTKERKMVTSSSRAKSTLAITCRRPR